MGENVVDVDAIRARTDARKDGNAARADILALCDAVERLRKYRSLPDGYVWQDYYSPEDVLKIRVPLDDEIERLRADLLEAADALGPMVPGAKVGGRGVAITAKAAVDEVLRLRAVIAEVEKLLAEDRILVCTCDGIGAVVDAGALAKALGWKS